MGVARSAFSGDQGISARQNTLTGVGWVLSSCTLDSQVHPIYFKPIFIVTFIVWVKWAFNFSIFL